MAILTYVYVFAVLFIADSMQSAYEPCAGKPQPKHVEVVGCKSLPCHLKRGTFAEASIDFEVLSNTKTLKPEVEVTLGNEHVKYPFPQPNACKNLVSGQCPLEKGETATYHMKMPVEKAYPTIDLTIEFSLVDEKQNTEVCFKIPAKVVD